MDGLFDGDTLVCCFFFDLGGFDGFVVGEVLDIFRVIVGFVGLGFGGGVELFWEERFRGLVREKDWTEGKESGPSWWRKNSVGSYVRTRTARDTEVRWTEHTALDIIMMSLCA